MLIGPRGLQCSAMLSTACAVPKITRSITSRRAPQRAPCSSRKLRIAPCASVPLSNVIDTFDRTPMRKMALSSSAVETPMTKPDETNDCNMSGTLR